MNFLMCFLSSVSLTTINPILLASEITYSHNNMDENDFFNNEVEEVIFKYIDSTLKDKATSHTHSIKIDSDILGFLYPLSSRLHESTVVYHTRAFLENNSNVDQVLNTEQKEETISETNEFSTTSVISATTSVQFNFLGTTLSMSFSKTQKHSQTVEEKRIFHSQPVNVPAKTKLVVDYSIVEEKYYKEYNLMLPIKNDEVFKSYSWKDKWGSTITRMFTPSEVFRAIQNDKDLLDYYFGKNEFYQYKDFIDHEWDNHYFWVAIPVRTYEEIDNLYLTIDPFKNLSNF